MDVAMCVVQLSVPAVRLILAKDTLVKASQDSLAKLIIAEAAIENGSPLLANLQNAQLKSLGNTLARSLIACLLPKRNVMWTELVVL